MEKHKDSIVMNWKEIKEKYPKAYECHNIWRSGDNTVDPEYTENYYIYESDIRELFDFFDENEIIIEITHTTPHDAVPIGCAWGWWSKINQRSYIETKNSRTEAETAAFTKAFEILEDKL